MQPKDEIPQTKYSQQDITQVNMKLDIKCTYRHFLGRRNADESIPKILSKAFVIAAVSGGETEVISPQSCSSFTVV